MIEVRTSVIERVVSEVGDCLTPDSARRIASLRAHAEMQQRIDQLAEKNAEGQITPEERSELDTYVSTAAFLSILQAEARRILREQGEA